MSDHLESRTSAQSDRSAIRLMCIALLMIVFGVTEMRAQAPTAAVTGTVTDTAGMPLPLSDVVARNLSAGGDYTSVTDRRGRYWLRGLPPGRYDLTASRIGVGSAVRRGLDLAVGQDVTVNFTLETRPIELPPLEVVDLEPPIQTFPLP